MNNAMSQGAVPTETLREAAQLFSEFGGTILGILPRDDGRAASGNASLEAELIQLIIDLRRAAREEKLWSLSDKIRDGLSKLGIVLEDKKDGTVWKRAD